MNTKPKPLTRGEVAAIAGVAIAIAALASIGFIVSFDTQTEHIRPYFHDLAPLVPLGIDIGILAFAALNLVLARLNMSITWLRAVPWLLTAMSLYINVNAYDAIVAKIAHIALPAMWIIAAEVGIHVLKIRAGLEADTRTEGLGVARWLLSPFATARLWRHMRLWGVQSAKDARASEEQRMEAKAALRFTYGFFWRVSTPVQLRVAYKLRRLAADDVYTWTAPRIGPRVVEVESEQVADVPAVGVGDFEDVVRGAEELLASVEPSPVVPMSPAPATAPAAEPEPVVTVVESTAVEPARTSPEDDAVVIELLQVLSVELDGPVSIRKARSEFGIGHERAKRLIGKAGVGA